MPTLIDLFKTQRITDGPNAGKTAEDAYSVKESKTTDIKLTNPILQPLIEKVNRRRKEQSLRLRETRLEEENVGLKTLTDTSKLVLYGGDYFRIINGTTRSKQTMLRNTGAKTAGLDDSISDKLGNALGNFVGDRIANGLQKRGDRLDPPPKLDARSLGIDIAADVASRTLGRLLPDPMIPSKVAQEFEKGRKKKDQYFLHEYDLEKRVLVLKNKKGLPKLIDNLLKNNKDIMGQTKDFLISTAGSIASDLVRGSVKKLNDVIFNNVKKTKTGAQQTAQPTSTSAFTWSSESPYSKARSLATLTKVNAYERQDLSTRLLAFRLEAFKAALAGLGKPVQYDITNAPANVLKALNSEKDKYSDNKAIQKKEDVKGMDDRADLINSFASPTFIGRSQTINNINSDEYDFIRMKFFSVERGTTIQFRCTISELTETFSPSWESNKFIGNPFPFYTYSSIERSVNFSFKTYSLNVNEHKYNWKRLNELASLVYPQAYKGMAGAVVPPVLEFTLGDMYDGRPCFIESMTFSVDEVTPWEIGTNTKLLGAVVPKIPTGFVYANEQVNGAPINGNGLKLPMIVNVDMTIKFLESRGNTMTNINLYGYK